MPHERPRAAILPHLLPFFLYSTMNVTLRMLPRYRTRPRLDHVCDRPAVLGGARLPTFMHSGAQLGVVIGHDPNVFFTI